MSDYDDDRCSHGENTCDRCNAAWSKKRRELEAALATAAEERDALLTDCTTLEAKLVMVRAEALEEARPFIEFAREFQPEIADDRNEIYECYFCEKRMQLRAPRAVFEHKPECPLPGAASLLASQAPEQRFTLAEAEAAFWDGAGSGGNLYAFRAALTGRGEP